MFLTTDWSIYNMFYALNCYWFHENTFKSWFSKIASSFGFFLRVEYDYFVLLLFNLWLYEVLSFLFSLDHCIFVRTIGVQIQRCFEFCGVITKGGVCSWWVQDHHFGVCVVIKVFDCLVEYSNVFCGLDVALG